MENAVMKSVLRHTISSLSACSNNFTDRGNTSVLIDLSDEETSLGKTEVPTDLCSISFGPWSSNNSDVSRIHYAHFPAPLQSKTTSSVDSTQGNEHHKMGPLPTVNTNYAHCHERESVLSRYRLPTFSSKNKTVKDSHAASKPTEVSHQLRDERSRIYIFRHLVQVTDYISDYSKQCSVKAESKKGKGALVDSMTIPEGTDEDSAGASEPQNISMKLPAHRRSSRDPYYPLSLPKASARASRRSSSLTLSSIIAFRSKGVQSETSLRTIYSTMTQTQSAEPVSRGKRRKGNKDMKKQPVRLKYTNTGSQEKQQGADRSCADLKTVPVVLGLNADSEIGSAALVPLDTASASNRISDSAGMAAAAKGQARVEVRTTTGTTAAARTTAASRTTKTTAAAVETASTTALPTEKTDCRESSCLSTLRKENSGFPDIALRQEEQARLELTFHGGRYNASFSLSSRCRSDRKHGVTEPSHPSNYQRAPKDVSTPSSRTDNATQQHSLKTNRSCTQGSQCTCNRNRLEGESPPHPREYERTLGNVSPPFFPASDASKSHSGMNLKELLSSSPYKEKELFKLRVMSVNGAASGAGCKDNPAGCLPKLNAGDSGLLNLPRNVYSCISPESQP